MSLAQLAQQRKAVALGQQDIEQDDVVGRGERKVARFDAVARHVDGVARFAQPLEEGGGDAAFILRDQQAHGVISDRSRLRKCPPLAAKSKLLIVFSSSIRRTLRIPSYPPCSGGGE